jgi:hypothetical protein
LIDKRDAGCCTKHQPFSAKGEDLMFSAWFGKHETTGPRSGSDNIGDRDVGVTGRPGPVQTATERQDQSKSRRVTAPNAASFEEIYRMSAMTPLKLSSGILKVAEMAESPHLAGMSPGFKQRALLMALEATRTDVSEILNDAVARQHALKEHEDAYVEKANQFEADRLEQNRREKAELDRLTNEFNARIQANLDEIDRCHRECREWQKNKQLEVQRLNEAATLCVQHERAEEGEGEKEIRIMAVPPRMTGTNR